MVRSCVLCGINKLNEKRSYFMFPKEPEQFSAWLKFCGMEPYHMLSSHKLCSLHFTSECFVGNGIVAKSHLRLKPGVIPTIIPSKKRKSKQLVAEDSVSVFKYNFNATKNVNIILHEHNYAFIIKNKEMVEDAETTLVLAEQTSQHVSKEDEEPVIVISVLNPQIEVDPLEPNVTSSFILNTQNITPRNALQKENTFSDFTNVEVESPNEKVFNNLRFFGDIASKHLETPRGIELCMNIAKRTVLKYRKQITNLHQRNRRLVKEIKSLKNIILDLKENQSQEKLNFSLVLKR